jgi:hypothetical protein
MNTAEAVTVQMLRAYEAALAEFWGNMTRLTQIVEEDFPDGQTAAGITRYHIDAMRELGARVGALVVNYDERD